MSQVQEAAKHVQEFERTKSLDPLIQAVQALVAAEPGIDALGSTYSQHRQQIGQEWLAVIHDIDQNRDPHFDPSDVPSVNLIPPTAKGVTYPSGVDPNAIPDAKVRAKYVKQLDENKQKTQRFEFQHRLRRLDARVSEGFQNFVMRAYREGEWSELESLLTQSNLTLTRRQDLLDRNRRVGFGK